MSRKALTGIAALIIVVGYGLIFGFPERADHSPGPAPVVVRQDKPAAGNALLLASYEQQQSKVWMEVNGVVSRLLSDDNDGSRHQRFILTIDQQHTVLVAHNIDLAERIPLSKGDRVRLRGRYEWNERGGVLHWTHHDPSGTIEGGWIEFDGHVYR